MRVIPAVLIAIGEFSSKGKTSLAHALQKEIPDAVHVDAGATRRNILGLAETRQFYLQHTTFAGGAGEARCGGRCDVQGLWLQADTSILLDRVDRALMMFQKRA